jgi:hypothetical protein
MIVLTIHQALVGVAHAQPCVVKSGRVANNIEAKLLSPGPLVNDRKRTLLQFSTPLQVTTDGAPDSYGFDARGNPTGINNICNAIQVHRVTAAGTRREIEKCSGKLDAFRKLQSNDWQNPEGLDIIWRGGIAASVEGDREIPCQYRTGKFAGFFATKTNLKNGLASDKGDCEINDQVDPRNVPGITIQRGANFIRDAGVQLGDLAIASFPVGSGKYRHIPAIVVDSGGTRFPAMGTIALNAALLASSGDYQTREAVLTLDMTDKRPVSITIIPGSFGYKLQRPYTTRNIEERLASFASEAGYQTIEAIARPLQCK